MNFIERTWGNSQKATSQTVSKTEEKGWVLDGDKKPTTL